MKTILDITLTEFIPLVYKKSIHIMTQVINELKMSLKKYKIVK